MHKQLKLPAVPPLLKTIAPYLQRADELYQKEPIIAYWCVYYATQAGIAAKVTKDNASRDFLSQLIGTLERLKVEIGPNDAVDLEAASAAYVENFALKVFVAADNEDRRGESTRSTAKKFLAAANFLEVLRTFPQAEISESIEDKVRYAKWKAADIAKAFREGRQPTPGPAGGEPEPSLQSELPTVPPPLKTTQTNSTSSSDSTLSGGHANDASRSPPKSGSPKRLSPPAIKRPSPPPVLDDMPPLPQRLTPPHFGLEAPSDGSTPGNWSTAATPGNTTASGTPLEDLNNTGPAFPSVDQPWGHVPPPKKGESSLGKHTRDASDGSNGTTEGSRNGFERPRRDSTSPRRVHFAAPQPPPPPQPSVSPPASFDPALLGYPSAPAPPSANTHSHPNSHLPFQPSAPPPPSAPVRAPSQPPIPPASQPEFELTPNIVAKAQKHCRFAISALDYEDAAQARKELRAALAILGG
ncbi:hypothetical protein V5O48_002543 [Marasmius crinis-equi]|uniref:DUF605-domain-containing protein n=1 Tax=Marasmius crinis-equi TaxID=585013 RepID=A0ABR3FVA1_9AGAR